jgi:cephalosporin-C deacetylase
MSATPYGEDPPAPVVYDDHPSVRAALEPDPQEPEDFDDFWAGTLSEADARPIDVERRPVPTPFKIITVEDLEFTGYGGTRVRAWLIRPAHLAAPTPLVVQYCGYGGGRGLPVEHLAWAAAGFTHLVMDTRGQGADTPDHPSPLGDGPDGAHVIRGLASPHTYYYRRLITDAVRAVRAGRQVPDVAPELTLVAGASQGGGLALAVSSLVPDIAHLICDIPFLCNWQRALQIADRGPYAEVAGALAADPRLAAVAPHTLSYFEGLSFAKRTAASAHFSVALRDRVCPPSTVLAAFGSYGGSKSIATYPFNDHEGGGALRMTEQVTRVAQLIDVLAVTTGIAAGRRRDGGR